MGKPKDTASVKEQPLDAASRKDESEDTESDGTNNSDESGRPPAALTAPLLTGGSSPARPPQQPNSPLGSAPTATQRPPSAPSAAARASRSQRDWEILEGLRLGQTYENKPPKFEGFMMKRRKWPMKGWHKRFFVLDNGILTYAKSPSDILKGKYHGQVDIGHVVIVFKRMRRMIDIDADDVIYHFKVSGKGIHAQFDKWIEQLRAHRLFRQHEIAFGSRDAPKLTDMSPPGGGVEEPVAADVAQSSPALLQRAGPRGGSFNARANTKVTAWLLDPAAMEMTYKEIMEAQMKIVELGSLLLRLQATPTPHNGATPSNGEAHLESPGEQPEKEKKRVRVLRFKPGRKKAQDELVQQQNGSHDAPLCRNSSSASLAPAEGGRGRPLSLHETALINTTPGGATGEQQAREDFVHTAKTVHDNLRHLSRTLLTERERMKHALTDGPPVGATVPAATASYIAALKQALAEANRQNEDYRSRLARIHGEASVATLGVLGSPGGTLVSNSENGSTRTSIQRKTSVLSQSASCESQSAAEFYDAEEYLLSASSSSDDDDDDDNDVSDVSDTEQTVVPASEAESCFLKRSMTGRRCKLPAPRPEDSNVSLFGLLRRNIGKDLSKISMPVSLNEPLSMLQRLCEELEYSELLDKAADTDDPLQRMCLVAAFSVSPYAATYYRSGTKPFNPLLGETYECIREDKGLRFIAEQVSHHPPITASFCESKNFLFWQDVRVKTKFWGKSMELTPQGKVQLKLPKYKDHYTWSKPTTCIHNLLGGQRWVDHYGEVQITSLTNGVTCKLTYSKSSYWSSSRHEVYGTVTGEGGSLNLFGKWNEGLYFGKHPSSAKCIWRPGSMPEDYDLYYGFTRFAMELNEIERDQTHLYPPTDTRFRRDQRYLEEGRLDEAEAEKHRVEQLQRERRKQMEAERTAYSPKWFLKSEEDDVYMYNGKYFDLRKDPGFNRLRFPELW